MRVPLLHGVRADGDHAINVINVATQLEDVSRSWTVRDWVAYYCTDPAERAQTLNVISLEFSRTLLSRLVVAPGVVRAVDWIDTAWPRHDAADGPQVQKYCLMGTMDSYTDFHIDFGGSSVWYHVFRGQKVFYFIPPTDDHLRAYEAWLTNERQSEIFFGDCVNECYECVVPEGATVFIPAGWIHAVWTPCDSLVFGGNFLHEFAVPLQLRMHALEQRVDTPDRFRFPHFESLMWYAARHMLHAGRHFGACVVARADASRRVGPATLTTAPTCVASAGSAATSRIGTQVAHPAATVSTTTTTAFDRCP